MKSEIINEKTSIPLNSHSRISLDERVRFLKSLKNQIKLNEEHIYEALDLDLKKPRYSQTSAYGHFGRELDSFTWEKVDMVEELQNKL